MIVIFDLDGTLADCSHRLHHIRPNPTHDPVTGKKAPRRFDRFERAIPNDTLIAPVVTIYNKMINDPDVTVLLLTGRSESAREITETWLTDNNLDGYEHLYMKETAFMPDTIQKEMVLDAIIEKYNEAPAMVFEDRARVVAMWKKRGIFVFNVEQSILPEA